MSNASVATNSGSATRVSSPYCPAAATTAARTAGSGDTSHGVSPAPHAATASATASPNTAMRMRGPLLDDGSRLVWTQGAVKDHPARG